MPTKIWYGIVASEDFAQVTDNWQVVERVKGLYAYPKWRKFLTEQEASEWVKKNKYKTPIEILSNYGDTIKHLSVHVTYKIMKGYVLYKIDTRDIGNVKLHIDSDNTFIEYVGNIIKMRVNNFSVSDSTLSGHLSVIHTLLFMLGSLIDVDIKVPYYGVFYALASYSGNKSNLVTSFRDYTRQRLGKVGISYGDYENYG